MKILSKMNTATKICILVVYTLLLAALAVLVINIVKLDENEGYGTSAKDENIQVVVKITETRTHSTSSTNPNSTFNLYFQVLKHNKDVEVSDIELHAKGKTNEGKDIYFEETKASSPNTYKGEPCTSGVSFKSFTSEFRKRVANDGTVTDTELRRIYLKVNYKVKNGEVTKDKELKYFFSLFDQYNNDNFKSFDEEITLNANNTYQDLKNESIGYYNLKIKYILPSETTKTTTVNTKQTFDESKIKEEGHRVVDTSFVIIGRINEDPKDPNKIFSKYIKLYESHGVGIDSSNLEAWANDESTRIKSFYDNNRTLSEEHNLGELYFFITITNEKGTTTYHSVKINPPVSEQ